MKTAQTAPRVLEPTSSVASTLLPLVVKRKDFRYFLALGSLAFELDDQTFFLQLIQTRIASEEEGEGVQLRMTAALFVTKPNETPTVITHITVTGLPVVATKKMLVQAYKQAFNYIKKQE